MPKLSLFLQLVILEEITTLNIVFSATYYMEIRNTTTINCVYHFLQTKVELVVWTFQKSHIFYLVKNYINSRKYNINESLSDKLSVLFDGLFCSNIYMYVKQFLFCSY